MLLLLGYLTWERIRDPIDAINKFDQDIFLLRDSLYFDSYLAGNRYYSEIELLSSQTDTIKAIISMPENYLEKHSPVITILGGIKTANLSSVTDQLGNEELPIWSDSGSQHRLLKCCPLAITRRE